MLAGAARRLKGGIDAGDDPFDVLVDCQDHVARRRPRVRRPGRARGVRRRRRALRGRRAARRARPGLRPATRCIAIEAERGWFQEHGRLSPTRSKAVIKAVNALCAELRADAGLLVDAFGVPETALGDAGRSVAAEQ